MINAYQKYTQQSVMTMTQGEMLIKLYDELITQLSAASNSISEKRISAANDALQRSQRIINYLRATLDKKYEISENLDALYEFFGKELFDANIKKDVLKINEIIPMIVDLRDAFHQASLTSRQNGAAR